MNSQAQRAARFAQAALSAYGLPEETALQLISLSENATFLVGPDQPAGVLRVYREGYQQMESMRAELSWINALRWSGTVPTPGVKFTAGGEDLLEVDVDGTTRVCVMFEYIDAQEMTVEEIETFTVVGRMAALLHQHVLSWTKPVGFERFVWDLEAILDPGARWGDWREGPGHTDHGRELLERAEKQIRARLRDYPLGAANAGLVHGDLRAANILKEPSGNLWVIDFDDCGFSWLLWDLCSATTFIEHQPDIDDIVTLWLRGYHEVRELQPEDLDVIPDLVFLRRMHILAWLGSHPESDLARDLGDAYTAATYEVAERYLAGNFLADARRPATA